MAIWLAATGIFSLLCWLVLWQGWGRFWQTDQLLPTADPAGSWPAVAVVVAARNEAEMLPQTLPSLLEQEYPGPLQLWLVDDRSADGTAAAAHAIAAARGREERLTVVSGAALPAGWSGKLWAVEQGLRASAPSAAPFVLLTDADIALAPGLLRDLVAKARREDLDLVSLMVRLRAESFWERLLIPAFVYFFALLYPFARVNDHRRATAAAAGGCLLLRRAALERAGGVASVADALIDDCALAQRIRREGRPQGGRLWLGLAAGARSLRPYRGLGELWQMVARTAFVQLRFSWLLLAATVVALSVVFLVPPLAVLGAPLALWGGAPSAAWWWAGGCGLAAWAIMTRTYLPILHWYGCSRRRALLLPLTAGLYTLMTLDSARRFLCGRGGEWKGRTYAPVRAGRQRAG